MAGSQPIAVAPDGDSLAEVPTSAPPILGYLVSLAMVAAAGVLAFVVERVVQAPNLSLVFVLPVVIAAAAYGWGPSLLAALTGVAMFDFFFVEPRLTFVVTSPTDLWAMALLLVVAGIVSAVAAKSRRRSQVAERASEQAEALHTLAHAVISGGPPATLLRAAAAALGRAFNAPALILEAKDDVLHRIASDRDVRLSDADMEAAQWVSANATPTRAETYPFDRAEFDFWPAKTAAGRSLVLGVRFKTRPDKPERLVELVAGYLAASSA